MQRMILIGIVVLGLLSASGLPAQGADGGFPEVMIILDGSGSMWGKTGDQTKIEAAKQVVSQLVPSLPAEVKLGLAAYGHRRKGSCEDIEIIIPGGSSDRERLLEQVHQISPKGKTPIAGSVRMVVDHLKTHENETTIILVSDGEETCHPDPCGLVEKLKSTGIKFILHVVGFDVNQDQQQQLACLAEAGGGVYYEAADAADLLEAFEKMQEEVVHKVTVAKAETTSKTVTSRLGKLRVIFPESGAKSLAHIRIVRQQDNKTIKTAEDPGADSTHPLLAGRYEVVLGYANSNYQEASEVAPITLDIPGGETTELRLGALVFNIADSLKDLPAGSVTLRSSDGAYVLKTPGDGNDYYFFTTKPLPPGSYAFEYHYKTMPETAILAQDIDIATDRETVLSIDSGLQIVENEQGMTGFDVSLVGDGTKVLQVRRRWDNSYPLWESFPLVPGNYSVQVYLKGMEEALPVGEIEIEQGQLLEFDTGL